MAGEQLTALPVWLVYHVGQTAAGYNALFAYVFETIDIEPVAGCSGKLINILVNKILNLYHIYYKKYILLCKLI